MKLNSIAAASMALLASVTLAACGNGSDDDSASTSSAAESSASSATSTSEAAPDLPTAAELNEVLARATDPNAAVDDKVRTVQDGDSAPEIFDVMAASKAESGADFQVVDPVLPGYTPNSVLTTVNFTLPDQPPQPAENVEFIFEDGTWKLSKSWACTLVTNAVPPEQVPAVCQEFAGAPGANDQQGSDPAPAEQNAPAEGDPAEGGPAPEAPAPADPNLPVDPNAPAPAPVDPNAPAQ